MVCRTCLPQGEKHSKQHLPHIPTARPRRQPNSLKHLLWHPVSCAMMRAQAAMLSGQPKQRPTPICPFPIFKGLHAFNRHTHCQTLHSEKALRGMQCFAFRKSICSPLVYFAQIKERAAERQERPGKLQLSLRRNALSVPCVPHTSQSSRSLLFNQSPHT